MLSFSGLQEAILLSGGVCLVVTLVPLLRYRPSVHGQLLAAEDKENKEDKEDEELASEKS